MVMEAEKKGVSSSLKNSTLLKQQPQKSTAGALGDMFKNMVDMKVMRGLCANGIPFNVLRNPQFHEMVSGISKTGDVICEFLKDAIERVGPSNVLQVVTDMHLTVSMLGKRLKDNTNISFGLLVLFTH